jgi:UDP-glucose:(heptosyl)LPS alpha-1,3-glucosyltransferase
MDSSVQDGGPMTDNGQQLSIAFVLRRFSTNGGTEKYVTDLSRFLRDQGHDIHLYTLAVEDGLRTERDMTFHRVLALPRGGALRAITLVLGAMMVPLDRFDVVQGFGRTTHHHVYRAGGGVHRAAIDAMANGWFGRLLNALSIKEWYKCYLDRAAFRNAKVVICNSEMAARQAGGWYGMTPNKIRVVRNGVDCDRFRRDPELREEARMRWGVPDGGRVALFLGNGFRRKGLAAAVKAFHKVASESDRFVVVGGRDSYAARILRPLQHLLGHQMVVVGSTHEPELEFVGADATIMPTLYDSAANTTIESMACGVPVVTTVRDGNAELIADKRLVVRDPRDVEEIARALLCAWECTDNDRESLRNVALTWTIARNGVMMERIYRELVDVRA